MFGADGIESLTRIDSVSNTVDALPASVLSDNVIVSDRSAETFFVILCRKSCVLTHF